MVQSGKKTTKHALKRKIPKVKVEASKQQPKKDDASMPEPVTHDTEAADKWHHVGVKMDRKNVQSTYIYIYIFFASHSYHYNCRCDLLSFGEF